MKPAIIVCCGIAGVFALLAVAGEISPLSAAMGFAASVVVTIIALRTKFDDRPLQSLPHRETAPRHGEGLGPIVAALPEPAIVVDAELQVMLCNPQAESLFENLHPGQSLSNSVRSPVLLDSLGSVVSSRQAIRVDYEQRVPIARHFEVFMTPLGETADTGAGEAGAAILILMRDLTQQEKVERMRADFVAHASHELRTPLAAVLGFIETLQGAAKDDVEARARFLDLMQSQANRMTRLIEDLLSLSRIELNAHIRPATTIDLERAVRHVEEYLAPLARESDTTISTQFSSERILVQGDWDELLQVFQNLIENAVKYGGDGGKITISVSAETDTGGNRVAEVAIADRGPGISPEHLPRLTERFYRVDVGASRARGGTGLGLAIVKHIVNRHRGRLLIDSTLGHGSTFTVRLPRDAAAVVESP
jgi:two-component system phosphate regulon sensor histidine kinase PhoR